MAEPSSGGGCQKCWLAVNSTDGSRLLSQTRFGNRYYENLNAEEEIPGVFFAFGRGVFSPFSVADIELPRPSPMG